MVIFIAYRGGSHINWSSVSPKGLSSFLELLVHLFPMYGATGDADQLNKLVVFLDFSSAFHALETILRLISKISVVIPSC